MTQISLGIPFYNTSKYFLDCIKYAVEDNFVFEIVVNDDCSSEKEYDQLLLLSKDISKVKIFKNKTNVGAFRNKYLTVKNCISEWVYLLDSDNYPFKDTYEILKSLSYKKSNICFSPRQLFCKNDNSKGYDVISDYKFNYDIIGIEETKDAIFKKKKWFDWFINTGNYVINRKMYLESLKEAFEDQNTPLLHADTAAAYYFMLKNDIRFIIVEHLRHNHRLRSDSYWNACGSNSMQSVEYYRNRMVEL